MKQACLRIFLVFLCLFVIPSCNTTAKKQREAISQAVYATHDSLNVGRVDLSKKYIGEATKLVPPPKMRITVKPALRTDATGKSEKVVILPEEFNKREVITVNSPEFDKLLAENAALKLQFESEKKEFDLFTKKVDDVQRKLAEELAQEKKSNSGLWGWIVGLTGTLGIVGTIVACVLFPPLIPIIGQIFTGIVGGISSAVSAIGKMFKKKE
jgi:hypothetical protein